MPSYDIFFFSIVFFLVGILAASFGFSFSAITVAVALLAAIFLFLDRFQTTNTSESTNRSETTNTSESINPATKKWTILAIISLFILLGAGYYRWDDSKFKDVNIVFNKKINFSGLIIDDPQINFGNQTLTVKLNEPYQGKISAKSALYPRFHYGDKLTFRGKIEAPPPGSYANYLAKENIGGLMNFPEIKLEKSGLGSPIKAALFNFKNSIVDSYSKILPPEQAALLAGLIFGERGGFSKEFKKAMSLSGTTHLTALSGQNITIISTAVAAAIGFFLPPFLTFSATILIILIFVAMTGFGPSAVRAAIMGFAVLLANLTGRIYDPRNSIGLAAFLITLFNPKALVFDLGFQLSFLAVLGIIYLRPALKKLLRFGDKPGFFAWRENFLMTLAAQLATAPVLIVNFGNFSFTALIANILILTAVPLTMSLGFAVGFFNFLSYYLALLFGWLASLLLNYEIFIINLFAKITLPINPSVNFWAILVYYSVLAGIVVYAKRP